jgi:mRNA-degrading endonuclease RelE of RelBE toxin-antitoxin system
MVSLKGLAKESGDIKPLTEELEGFLRLRVGSHRVIFEYEMINGVRTITCVFAGSRRWIYEVLQSRFTE